MYRRRGIEFPFVPMGILLRRSHFKKNDSERGGKGVKKKGGRERKGSIDNKERRRVGEEIESLIGEVEKGESKIFGL